MTAVTAVTGATSVTAAAALISVTGATSVKKKERPRYRLPLFTLAGQTRCERQPSTTASTSDMVRIR